MAQLNSTKPITPSLAKANKVNSIPKEVIEAFNECITENFNGSSATVLQKEVVARIRAKMGADDVVVKTAWLDIEPVFEAAGWKVEYDKPGYCESYDASFKFTAKRETTYRDNFGDR